MTDASISAWLARVFRPMLSTAWLILLVAVLLLGACGSDGATVTPAELAPPTSAPATATELAPTPAPVADTPAPAQAGSLDEELRGTLSLAGIEPLDPGPAPDPAKVALGHALFFDKVLGGDQSVSCSTCHHPLLATTDGIPLSIGVGGTGLGPDRILGGEDRRFIRRNAPEVFNRGSPEWTTMFWDSRVNITPEGDFDTPADEYLPPGLDSVLAAQALFPVTSDQEMRSPVVADGRADSVTELEGDDFVGIWQALMVRVMAIPEYRDMLAQAYPDIPADELGFQHVANALAAFQIDAFTFLDSPWDRYVQGDDSALSDEAKRGALLFYSKAGCVRCHAGNLFTDQVAHNVAVPQLVQLGNNPDMDPPLDMGRARESRAHRDTFAFRTPPLRNVSLTGPWMHDGVYTTLEGAVRHMLSPQESLMNYDAAQLPPLVQPLVQDKAAKLELILGTLDPLVWTPVELTDEEFSDLMAFLLALTDPAAEDLEDIVPSSVPSGLPVED